MSAYHYCEDLIFYTRSAFKQDQSHDHRADLKTDVLRKVAERWIDHSKMERLIRGTGKGEKVRISQGHVAPEVNVL